MAVLGSRFGTKLLGLGLGIGVGVVVMTPPAFAQTAAPVPGPVDPYGPYAPNGPFPAQAAPPPAPPPLVISAPPVPPVPPGSTGQSGGNTSNNTNTNTVDPVITASPTITANPTNTNTATNNANNTNENKNDNRSNATATNNNTIYIYPPAYAPPPAVPAATPPLVAQPSMFPPPLVPPPMLPPYSADSPYYRPRRIRLNCQRLCAAPPQPISPVSPMWKRPERFRVVSLGGHFTVLGMANQPLAGWGTLYGGGVSLEFRSRGHFGFELSQDFLHGTLGHVNGTSFERKSYPFEFTLKGYVMPNSDKHHFNMFFGGGFGVMPSNVDVPLGDATFARQDFLEWMIHGDVGAELRFKWLSLGAEGRIEALYRDRSYGAGALYGDIKDAPVPSRTWGVEGRAFMKFWF